MSIDIGRYINYSLYKKGAISLDGIGTISLIRESAYFSLGNKEIFPPKTKYEFSENIEDSLSLANTIYKNEKITFESAQHYVSKYCQDILNGLLNYNIVKVGEIGFLENKEGNTVFIPSEKTLSKTYFGLPALELNPIAKKIKPTKDDVFVSSPNVIVRNRDKYEWLNYLGALILGAIMVLAYHYFLDPLPYMSQNKAMDVPAKLSNQSDPKTNQENFSINLVDEKKQKDIALPDSSSSSSNEDGDKIEDTSSVVLAKPKEDTECIIIVGVFNKTIKALELSDKLRSDGYVPYKDDHFATQRVGVRFKCADIDLEEMINKIRRRYNSKAWYLVPQVSI